MYSRFGLSSARSRFIPALDREPQITRQLAPYLPPQLPVAHLQVVSAPLAQPARLEPPHARHPQDTAHPRVGARTGKLSAFATQLSSARADATGCSDLESPACSRSLRHISPQLAYTVGRGQRGTLGIWKRRNAVRTFSRARVRHAFISSARHVSAGVSCSVDPSLRGTPRATSGPRVAQI